MRCMADWVVTLRNGQQHDVEAQRYDRRTLADGSMHHEFSTPPDQPRHWPDVQVVRVQERDGYRLVQVWPREGELDIA